MTRPADEVREIEELARKLHEWYLLATEKLNPDSYNPKAQKQYDDLTPEQQSIDIFIAGFVLAWHVQQVMEKFKGFEDTITELRNQLSRLRSIADEVRNILGGPIMSYAPKVAMKEYEERIQKVVALYNQKDT